MDLSGVKKLFTCKEKRTRLAPDSFLEREKGLTASPVTASRLACRPSGLSLTR